MMRKITGSMLVKMAKFLDQSIIQSFGGDRPLAVITISVALGAKL
jgi:hypothetical protein